MRKFITLFLLLAFIAHPARRIESQGFGGVNQSFDPITRNALDEIERLLNLGNYTAVQERLGRIIDGSGYIFPLAKVYHRLAQTESNMDNLLVYYGTIITHWYESAWAQQAVIEAVPLVLMSGGNKSNQIEDLVWKRENALLAPSADAETVGKDPDELRTDVFIQLVQLAHHRNDHRRVKALLQNGMLSLLSENQDMVELAGVYADIRSESDSNIELLMDQWLQKHPSSNLRAFAMLALYQTTKDESKKAQILETFRQEYPDTLEALLLKSFLTGN